MPRRTQWNNMEDDQLQGLSLEAQLVYLRALRRNMDYTTGYVGIQRTVSYQQIRETLEFVPPQGSKRKAKHYTSHAVRAILKELDRVGLAQNLSKQHDKGLTFFLPEADKAGVYFEHEPRQEPHDEPRPVSEEYQTVTQHEPHDEPRDEPRTSGTIQQLKNTGVRACEETIPGQTFQKPIQWVSWLSRKSIFPHHQLQNVSAFAMFKSWIEQGVTTELVQDAMDLAYTQLDRHPDNPRYYARIVEQMIRQQQRAHEEHVHEQRSKGSQQADRRGRSGRPVESESERAARKEAEFIRSLEGSAESGSERNPQGDGPILDEDE